MTAAAVDEDIDEPAAVVPTDVLGPVRVRFVREDIAPHEAKGLFQSSGREVEIALVGLGDELVEPLDVDRGTFVGEPVAAGWVSMSDSLRPTPGSRSRRNVEM